MSSQNPLLVEAYWKARYQELLQEIDRERLVRQALSNKCNDRGHYQRLLAYLGSKLVSLGQHLQENYGPASEKAEYQPPAEMVRARS